MDKLLGEGQKKFINKYMDLINANKFTEFYQEVNEHWMGPRTVFTFTEIFLAAGINPIEHFEKWIPRNYLRGSSLSEIEITPNITSVGEMCFGNMRNLKSIVIPENVTHLSLGGNTFFACGNLESVIFKGDIDAIPGGCFDFCSNLRYLEIPKSVKKIDCNFLDCKKLDFIRYEGNTEDFIKVDVCKWSPDHRIAIECWDGEIVLGDED